MKISRIAQVGAVAAIAVLTLAGLTSGFATTSAYAVDCANPPGFAERRACEKAAQGIHSLQRYVERTRAVHGLYVYDFKDALSASDLAQLIEPDKRFELARNDKR